MNQRLLIAVVSHNLFGPVGQAALDDTLSWILNTKPPCDVAVLGLEPSGLNLPAEYLLPDTRGVAANLGESAGDVLGRALSFGYEQICVVGTATPHLPSAFAIQTWGHLARPLPVLVLGASENGGFYLVGLNLAAQFFVSPLLAVLPGSEPSVSGSDLQEEARGAGIAVAHLPRWYGIAKNRERLRIDLGRGTVYAPAMDRLLQGQSFSKGNV